MQTAIRKIGKSVGVILPETVLAHLEVSVGDLVEIKLEKGRLILSPVKVHPRAAWAQAAKELAASGNDVTVWPLFSNAGDERFDRGGLNRSSNVPTWADIPSGCVVEQPRRDGLC